MIPQYEETDISSPARPKFSKFFTSINKWQRLNQFSIKNLVCIYNYLLKKSLTVGIIDISTSRELMPFFLHLTKIFAMTQNFWKKRLLSTG